MRRQVHNMRPRASRDKAASLRRPGAKMHWGTTGA